MFGGDTLHTLSRGCSGYTIVLLMYIAPDKIPEGAWLERRDAHLERLSVMYIPGSSDGVPLFVIQRRYLLVKVLAYAPSLMTVLTQRHAYTVDLYRYHDSRQCVMKCD